jgi:nucleotide-binding universal stress UspA family protein
MDVLFATDGRPPAVAAGELLRRLVAPSHVDVTVLHASEFGNEVAAESYAQDVFAAAEASLGGAGIPTHMVFTEGDPAGSIVKELAQGAHHLTVVGAGNHTWLGRLVLGSVSTYVLHEAPVPVLVVHRAPDPSHERLYVLVGADGSPSAAHAIDTLASITEPGRVDIHARTVIRTPELAFSAYPGAYVPASFIEEQLAAEKAIAIRHLNESLERVRSLGFTADGSVGTGWPANDLLEYAQTVEADLLVVGARGIGVIERLTMGSVSAHVAGHAPAALVAHARAHPLYERPIEESHGPEVPLGPDIGGAP